ncbi:MAG: DUF4294 domain-containing protein [Bacteroidia bacterium]|nr:DUF4294 domain-containing protein [Bacteroidia bacterium]
MKNNIRKILVLLIFLPWISKGQTTITDTAEYNRTHSKKVYFAAVAIHDGDTLPAFYLAPVFCRDKMVFKSAKDERKWRKLVRDVKKVYPYAKIAGSKLRQCEAQLALPENQGRKKELMKKAEKEIKAEFEGDVRNMTWTQGIILLKLIDRETTHSSYEIVKELRGSLSAFFWQSLARIFDINLKTEYDPGGSDRQIEEIVQKIERGEL